MRKHYDYDVIIIGAGIGGLVCGCYLAKAGMKVLIVEKNPKVGGYCTSFVSRGFSFDAYAHSFGSCRENGSIGKVIQELGVRLRFNRYGHTEFIISPDYKISFWSDVNKTIQEFQNKFPKENKNINSFFSYLADEKDLYFIGLRNETFKNFLGSFFKDNKLKAILALPVLGYGGLPPSIMSARTAAVLYKEFLIDGGYYPEGGMQQLSDALANKFHEFGGNLMLSQCAKRIKVERREAKGVFLGNNKFVSSKYVLSDCDTKQTFLKLIGKQIIGNKIFNRLNGLIPSLSMFVLYLGIERNSLTLPEVGCNVWFLPKYDIEDMYIGAKNRKEGNLKYFWVRLLPDKKSIIVLINASFENKQFWSGFKNTLANELIKRVDSDIIPNLSRYIVFKGMATPYTLYQWTFNYRGAAYGWATLPSQFAIAGLSQTTTIRNLCITGHWNTFAQGIGGVAYLGRQTASLILKKEK